MKKHFFLLYLLVGLLSGCSQDSVKIKDTVIENVNAEMFNEFSIDKDILLDVRTIDEIETGVIKGAIHIDYTDLNFPNNIKDLDTNKTIYVYCRSGRRSSKASIILKKQGFKKVYNLIGGISEWQKERLPIEK